MANKFVIEVRAKGFKNLETQFKKADAATKGYTKSTKQLRGATSGLRRNIGALRNNILLYTFAVGAAVKMTSTFVRSASKFEQVRTRLVGLTGSVVKANQAFDTFNAVAATTPFSLEDVVNAGAQLKAFGSDAEALIKPVTDLAAFMGTTATEAANSFGRAFAGGAGAADILRERGILNIIKSSQGLTDLSTTTLPEFRKALISSLQDPAVGIAGSTDRMSQTFEGAMSNMKDSLTRLSAEVGAVMLPALKGFSHQLKELSDDAITFFQQFTGTEAQKMLAHLKQIGVDSKALSALEAIVFTEKTEENIDNINQAMVRLLQGNKGLTKQFKDFGGEVKTIQEVLFGTPIGEPRIDDVSISVENAAELLDILKQQMNEVQAGALGMANSIGKNNQATSEASKEAAEHFLALASLVAMLTEQDNLYKRLAETIAELSATAPLVQVVPPDPAKILASAKAFKQFSDNIAQATLEGQNMGKAVVNALQAIAVELAAQAVSFAILSMFSAGPLAPAKLGFHLLGAIGHKGGKVTDKGVQRFARGGSVMGGDNVPILAQAGEFIIKRDSVNAIGLDQLRQMNETGQPTQNVSINIHGGIVQEDFVRNELIPAMNREGVGLVRS